MSQKFITLKRPKQSRIPSEIMSESYVSLGSSFDSNTNDILKGLTFEEEKAILPNLIGCSADSYEFIQRARTFWMNIDITIPVEGKRLNITVNEHKYKNKDGEEVTDIIPVAPMDYVQYRFALKHSLCGNSLEDCESIKSPICYIEDAGILKEAAQSSLALKIKARSKYQEVATGKSVDLETLKAVLIATRDKHNKTIPTTEDAILITLEEVSEKFPQEFITACTDPLLKQKAFVTQLIEYNIVKSAGNSIYDDSVGIDAIADNIEDFIKYFSKPANTAYQAQLKAKLDSKKGK